MDEILKGIADNPALTDAVRKVLEKQYEAMGSLDVTLNDAELGQVVRARLVGLRKIDEAFKEIATYKTAPKVEEKVNPAR